MDIVDLDDLRGLFQHWARRNGLKLHQGRFGLDIIEKYLH